MLWKWDAFIKEGDELFSYMVQHFEEMCSDHIKHFDIIDRRYRFTDEVKEIKEIYLDDIRKELYYWIKKEHISLLDKDNWKPFRDQESLCDMFLGYRKMFQYKQYYFQLSMETDCDYDDCMNIHFKLVLYGWKDDISDTLQPDNRVIIPPDNMMPDYYWDRR